MNFSNLWTILKREIKFTQESPPAANWKRRTSPRHNLSLLGGGEEEGDGGASILAGLRGWGYLSPGWGRREEGVLGYPLPHPQKGPRTRNWSTSSPGRDLRPEIGISPHPSLLLTCKNSAYLCTYLHGTVQSNSPTNV